MTISDPAFDALAFTSSYRGTKLDLTGFTSTFAEVFTDPATLCNPGDVNPICKMWAGTRTDVGGLAKVRNRTYVPSPYAHSGGVLNTNMALVSGVWQTGQIQSINSHLSSYTAGFTQGVSGTGGSVFRARMRFPLGGGIGTWPAFWLRTPIGFEPDLEIDVIEAYGDNADGLERVHVGIHLDGVYHKGANTKLSTMRNNVVAPGPDGLQPFLFDSTKTNMFSSAYRTYAVRITPQLGMQFYYEDFEIYRFPWSEHFRYPLSIMADLAMRVAPDYTTPKQLSIDHINAWKKP